MLLLTACDNKKRTADRLDFDSVVSGGVIQKIAFVDDELDVTNNISGPEVQPTANFFSATNRKDVSIYRKTYAIGRVFFYDEYRPLAALHHSQDGVFSYGQYNFRLRATNELQSFFPGQHRRNL